MLIELDMESGEICSIGEATQVPSQTPDWQALPALGLELRLPSAKDEPVPIPRIDDIDAFLVEMSQAR